MANIALLEDPVEMRQTASAIETLKEDLQRLMTELKASIEEELNNACRGEVADEFTKMYNEKIHPQLEAEAERLENVVLTIRTTANRFEQTSQSVMSSF